jgi:hypothetical protein
VAIRQFIVELLSEGRISYKQLSRDRALRKQMTQMARSSVLLNVDQTLGILVVDVAKFNTAVATSVVDQLTIHTAGIRELKGGSFVVCIFVGVCKIRQCDRRLLHLCEALLDLFRKIFDDLVLLPIVEDVNKALVLCFRINALVCAPMVANLVRFRGYNMHASLL